MKENLLTECVLEKGNSVGNSFYDKRPDGKLYNGQWSKNKMNGHGILTTPDNKVIVGVWTNGEFLRLEADCSPRMKQNL